jgi:NADH dehydrogenase FAD-containing subunit
MSAYDIIIIGGGPAGVQAALSARNTNQDKSIALLRMEKVALIPCGIPYILHSLSSVDDDILPDALLGKNNIELLVGEVTGREGKTLLFSNGQEVVFDKLVLATG